jgi:hypothetical protein
MIRLVSEEGTDSRPVDIVKALIETGRLPRFAQATADGWPVWHTICQLEDDLLAFNRKNRWCGMLDGWTICLGHSDEDAADLPVYQQAEWGALQCWLRYEDTVVLPGDGAVRFVAEDEFDGSLTAHSPLADYSGIRLNLLLKP